MSPFFGQPVKGVRLMAGGLQSRGEWVVSEKGIEGGGVYEVSRAVRGGARLTVDVLPEWTVFDVSKRLSGAKSKESVGNRLRKVLRLAAVERALVMEWGRPLPAAADEMARLLKSLPVPVDGPMALDGAISTAGGLPWERLDGWMIRARPGVFAAGEMIAWDAPTGGYLLTACLASGRAAGEAAAEWVRTGSGTF